MSKTTPFLQLTSPGVEDRWKKTDESITRGLIFAYTHQDPSSPSGDQIHTLYIGSTESQPLDHKESAHYWSLMKALIGEVEAATQPSWCALCWSHTEFFSQNCTASQHSIENSLPGTISPKWSNAEGGVGKRARNENIVIIWPFRRSFKHIKKACLISKTLVHCSGTWHF